MKYFLFLIIPAFLLWGCNDESVIGSDLLDDEKINLDFENDFELIGTTVKGDTVPTFNTSSNNQTYLLGELEDPIFGTSSSDIYVGFQYTSGATPDYSDAVFDSIVLSLEYDSLGFYGNPDAIHHIQIYRVTEDFLDADTLYSDREFMTESNPIGEITIVPNLDQTVSIKYRNDENIDSTIELTPRIRIRLDDVFGKELFADTSAATSTANLVDYLKGFKIVSTVEGSSMIGLNFNEDSDGNAGIGGLIMYYTDVVDGEDTKSAFTYGINTTTFSHFEHDYSGSFLNPYLENQDAGDDYLFVQSMAGVNTEIQLPDLTSLQGNLINAAQLVMTISEESEFETELYPNEDRFLLSKYNDSGNKVLIDDIVKNGFDLTTGLTILGGGIEEVEQEDGSIIKVVRFNITDYIRNVIEGEETSDVLVVSPLGRQESPRRIVFYGVNHPEYPVELRIAYTNI